ncbi:acetyl-CoA synthetase-like protein [Cylindrobasidium torrendii FP15055 ss-10]|uniref:Acetyl-CoA synthetase-like protein n=1 Tax=Cylindrobasidium torrendii FP15055 ss-10 TaxID=1314674 RepID=A0A0D7BDT1_9AGAR|nr:acetyl-CoA synthetase-like protein [Cylindrobasidium torrendii FP15055 ss-10]
MSSSNVKIYSSTFSNVPLVNRGVFSYFLGASRPGYVGEHPANWPAFTDAASGATITRGHLRALSLQLGHGLTHHATLRASRNDTALIFAPNILQFPLAMFGSWAAGLRVTLANSAYNARELAHQYTNSGASLVYTTEDHLQTVRDMFTAVGLGAEGDKRIIIIDGLRWAGGANVPPSVASAGLVRLEDLLSMGAMESEEIFEGQGNETTLLCYSSGTTGKPKGVETTHHNLTSMAEILQHSWDAPTSREVMLAILPCYHIYGCVMQLLWTLRAGIKVVLQARFEPEAWCRNIQTYAVSLSLVVPPVLVHLARHPAVEKYDMKTLKVMVSGAAPLGPDLTRQALSIRVAARLASFGTHVAIIQGYGLTETSPVAMMVPTKSAESALGSIGVLLPNLQSRLVADDGLDAKEGEPGEIWIRGPTVMKGYLKNASATAGCINSEGWFQTGDIAVRTNEGFYYIVDRKKELIKYKGFQVPPAELEALLLNNPDVADAAVVGVYDDAQATELPRAYIVAANPSAKKAQLARDVIAWTKARVASHKQLRGGVAVIDVIPKSAAGKILRKDLRERAKVEAEANMVKARM